ncbi:molybdopterin molybdenumtransferase MoeA [Maritimibacter sp. 55A14]|uniref:molybdopterin molybdotransferase MoeA n=1 Tax=Maritimibacter sp. 55A14 TaxID=2174844 RepID=UPI000D60E0C2|nr:gephyrin-like molybdotransferase Glp [Maritimibacter sp. 55A14]PWE34281.1 molybdopterin molybdenumtransferase MoeA [Maritimibacter sp. 55A14]
MISTEEALAHVLALCRPLGVEHVPLAEAAGRVLAEPMVARRTQPPFAASAMDGYALDGAGALPGSCFKIIGEAVAGKRFSGAVNPGEAVRIFTGAPVPEGASRVVIQEDVVRDGDTITLGDDLGGKDHIRPAGDDFKAGDRLEAPRRLSPSDIALLAAMNHAELPVARRPEIAVIPTGDELVAPGEDPGPDQIIASNSYGLKALLEAQGARVRLLPIARDTAASLGTALELARGADMIVTIGGASVGDHDLVRQVAGDRGLALEFYKIRMRPGKPLMAGRIMGSVMVGLPGNPVSAMVCGHIFLRPAVDAMLGLKVRALPRMQMPLEQAIRPNGGREHYMRARLVEGAEGLRVRVFGRQDSALLSVLGDADALVVRPPDDPARAAGEQVDVIRL